MNHLLILSALVLVPVVIIVALKVNAAIAFMSLCLGSVLVTYTSSDATDLVTSFTAKGALNVSPWIQIALLTTPYLLAMLFTRKTVHGSSQVINFLPAVASGLLYALLTTPLLSASLQRSIRDDALWHQVSSLQTAIVLSGAVSSLLFILLSHRAHRAQLHAEKKHGK